LRSSGKDLGLDDELDELPVIKTRRMTSAMLTMNTIEDEMDAPVVIRGVCDTESEQQLERPVKNAQDWRAERDLGEDGRDTRKLQRRRRAKSSAAVLEEPVEEMPEVAVHRRRKHRRPRPEDEFDHEESVCHSSPRPDRYDARTSADISPCPDPRLANLEREEIVMMPMNELSKFAIVKEGRKFAQQKGLTHRLMDGDTVVCVCYKETKKRWKIAARARSKMTSEDQWLLTVEKDGKRIRILDEHMAKPRDDRTAEVLGLARMPNDSSGRKQFCVIFPREGAHFPVSKEKELWYIAEASVQAPESVDRKRFLRMQTAPPGIGGMGAFPMGFEHHQKNCVIYTQRDGQRDVRFMLYRVAAGNYGVGSAAPWSPALAFGMSVALITD
jgi:hypothetical protein